MAFPSKHCWGGVKHSSAKNLNHRCHGEAVNVSIQLCVNGCHRQRERSLLSSQDNRLSATHIHKCTHYICKPKVSVSFVTSFLYFCFSLLWQINKWVQPWVRFSVDACPSLASAFLNPGEGKPTCFSLYKSSCRKRKVIFSVRKIWGDSERKSSRHRHLCVYFYCVLVLLMCKLICVPESGTAGLIISCQNKPVGWTKHIKRTSHIFSIHQVQILMFPCHLSLL